MDSQKAYELERIEAMTFAPIAEEDTTATEYLIADEYANRAGKLQEYASANGLILTEAKPNELFIDIDDSTDLFPVQEKLRLISTIWLPIKEVWNRVSRGGKGLHVRVVFHESVSLDYRERAALQAIAGSDGKREILTLREALIDPTDNKHYFLDKPSNPEVLSTAEYGGKYEIPF